MKILMKTKTIPYAVSTTAKEFIKLLKENSVFISGVANNIRFNIYLNTDNVEWDGKNFILLAEPGTEDKTFYEEAK